jgi:hypothetical protein
MLNISKQLTSDFSEQEEILWFAGRYNKVFNALVVGRHEAIARGGYDVSGLDKYLASCLHSIMQGNKCVKKLVGYIS